MNLEIMEKILEKIKHYDRIMIFRHVRNDGDCVGASKGLKTILKLTWPEKEVYLIDTDTAAYLEFLGPEDEPVDEELYKDALGIVVDTASENRISNKNYKLCKELIKIDHHIPLENYGDLHWVEEAAATLLDVGVDIETLYARLYLEAYGYLKFKASVYERMQITENGIAYLFVDKAMQEEFNLTQEQASACVGNLDSIREVICWMVFIENCDEAGSIRVRLRSRFVTINEIAEKYHGGGHANASGATVYSIEEMQQLLKDADAHVKQYKETHEGWL